MYGSNYANNLRKNLLSATDKGLMDSPKKADLKYIKIVVM